MVGGAADLFCWPCDALMVVCEAWKIGMVVRWTLGASTQHLLENDEEEWKSVVRGLAADDQLHSEDARARYARRARTEKLKLTVAKWRTIFC